MYGHKKDHGIADNGHTKRWCYRDIPWFILNGCRWFRLTTQRVNEGGFCFVVYKLDVL